MIEKWHGYLARRPLWFLSVIVMAMIAIVAVADFLTGPMLSFSIFYVAPVALASWYAPRSVALVTCLVSTVAWLTIERISIDYPNGLIPVWNAAVRLGFFAITSALLVKLRFLLDAQKELADVDGLTGVFNRRAFESRCRYLFQLADRQKRPISLAYLDIDNFKTANDQYGHQAGDRILSEIAAVLIENLRRTDLIGRMGGDEFSVALPDTTLEEAGPKGQRLVERLRGRAATDGWPIGFSLGIVACRPPVPDFTEALNQADKLMYDVKQRASDGCVVAEFRDSATTGDPGRVGAADG